MSKSRKELLAMQETIHPSIETQINAAKKVLAMVQRDAEQNPQWAEGLAEPIANLKKEIADLEYEQKCDEFDQTMGPDPINEGDFADIEAYFMKVAGEDGIPEQ